MLAGERVVLRPLTPADYPDLWQWHLDVASWASVTPKPLWPTTYEGYVEHKERVVRDESVAEFAIDVDASLVGRCGLYSVDSLARNADLGISLGAEHRGRGYGRDAIAVLLDYAFTHRNLHRVRLELLASNTPALRAYTAAGFVEEGRLREQAWVEGAYADMIVMGLLRSEWRGRRG